MGVSGEFQRYLDFRSSFRGSQSTQSPFPANICEGKGRSVLDSAVQVNEVPVAAAVARNDQIEGQWKMRHH
jgi:hypothetical protein